jgi:putative membrane protein
VRENPYLRFRERQLTLNDLLAIDRTVLANERTVLAYARTALALLAIGGSCIKFFDSWWIEVVGVIFIAMAAAVAGVGWMRFHRVQRWMKSVMQQRDEDAAQQPPAEAAGLPGDPPTAAAEQGGSSPAG